MATTPKAPSQAGLNALLILSLVAGGAAWGWSALTPDQQAALTALGHTLWDARDDPAGFLFGWARPLVAPALRLLATAALALWLLWRFRYGLWGILRLLRGPRPDQTSPSRPRGVPPSPGTGGAVPGGRTDGRTDGRPGGRMEWLTGEDFAVLAGEPPATLWGPCLEEGSVTLMPGVPKAGKSLVLSGLVGAIVAGLGEYLGWPVHARPGGEPVVVLCEETPRTYRHKAMLMAGVTPLPLGRWQRVAWRVARAARRRVWGVRSGKPDIYVRSGPLAGPKGAAHIRQHLLDAAELALSVGARLIVLDSIKHWCQEAVTQDDPAGVLMEAAKEVAGMTHPKTKMGLIVVLIHHLSETDGRMLGPTTLFSQADFRGKVTPPAKETVTSTKERVITWEGRFDGEAPAPLSYRMVDGRLEAGKATAAASVRTPVPAAPAADHHTTPEQTCPPPAPQAAPREVPLAETPPSPTPLRLPVLTPEPAATAPCTNPAVCIAIRGWLLRHPDGGGVTGGVIERETGIAHGTLTRHLRHLLADGSVVTTEAGGRTMYWLSGRQPLEPCQAAG